MQNESDPWKDAEVLNNESKPYARFRDMFWVIV